MNIAPKCDKCGKPLWNDGSSTVPPDVCTCYLENRLSFVPVGWICPICGTVVAPFIWQCPNPHYGWISGEPCDRTKK